LGRVYRAVAWQRVDQIRYIMLVQTEISSLNGRLAVPMTGYVRVVKSDDGDDHNDDLYCLHPVVYYCTVLLYDHQHNKFVINKSNISVTYQGCRD
jgi:hypothetical protein